MHYMTKMKIKKMSIHLMQSQSQIVWCNFYYIVYKFLLPVYFITITIYIHISKGNIYFIYVIIKKEKCDRTIFACLVCLTFPMNLFRFLAYVYFLIVTSFLRIVLLFITYFLIKIS